MAQTTELVVRKEISVRCGIDRAFAVFTAETNTWWPMATHSVSDENCVDVRIEPRVGGRIIETERSGVEHEWGRITAWEPPHRLAFTWHPGFDPAQAGDVEVTFAADPDHTRVTLEHRGFEKRGADATTMHRNYASGWQFVFNERYGARANGG